MPLPRAYLIDSSIYIFRAWHIYENSITNSEGKPVNAVLGFSDFLWQLIRQKQPQHIACAFDESQTDSYRREMFPEYKANRDPAPEDLKNQFSLCRDFCDAIGLSSFGSDRFEADDIIGTLATRLRKNGFAVTIVSADKDLTQLVIGEEDAWWDFARGTVLNQHGVVKQFGVRPQQIADMLALSGDKVDNIPGIPGVGYKLAAKLLQKYPCIDTLLENLDQVASMKFRGAARVHALLTAHKDMLPLNRKLTTIVTDVVMDDCDLRWKGFNEDAFNSVCKNLSLNDMIQRRWRNLNLAEGTSD